MKNCLMIIAIGACTVCAQDLVLSKDSLWVLNNFRPSRNGDSVTIINNGAEAIWLDSGQLFFDQLDTGHGIFDIRGSQMVMDEWHNGAYKRNFFNLKQNTDAGFYLDFSSTSKPVFSIGPSSDRIIIGNAEIVDCYYCDEPRFPTYIRGTVRFFFTNGQSVDILLYSDDLRPPVRVSAVPARHCGSRKIREGDFIIMERDDAAGMTPLIEIFDCLGKMVEKINLPISSHASRTIRLNRHCYPAGWYYIRVRSGASNCRGRAFVVGQ